MTEGCLVNANYALTPLLSQRLLSLRCVSSSHKIFASKSFAGALLQRRNTTLIRLKKLALALLMALVLRTNNHNLTVSLDYLAFIAHRLY